MAKSRMINTKFWSDPWVMTKLNPLDRLLFLYLLTNEHTNISGVYEISEHKIAFDTGLERDTVVKIMLPRLEPKVYFKDNWVVLTNFAKHQNLKSKDVILGIKREFEQAPKEIQNLALDRGWGDGLYTMPDTKPNLTKPNLREKPLASLSYLEKLPDQDLKELSEKYKIAPHGVQNKATDLKLYCQARNKHYKNYRAFLENALRKDQLQLRRDYPPRLPPPRIEETQAMSPEQFEAVKARGRELALKFKAK